ncbi:MAG: hypothetical protein PHZ26_01235 [Candidatus Gracilibacteria bacterium]|nr:hypothetical protein [Candidatus Gracilibacteria bacterium]MDD2908358.1 hypothetical protein [Candidatus Gracilibacteria bacterium]
MSIFQVPFDISLLKPSELIDKKGDYIDIWKQESLDDTYLMEYFFETPAYNELCKTKKYIVSGRKGTGKTALRRAFTDKFGRLEDYYIHDLEVQDLFTPTFFNNLQEKINNDPKEVYKSYIDIIGWMVCLQWVQVLLKNDFYIHDDFHKSVLPDNYRILLETILKLNGYVDLGDIGVQSLTLKKVKTTNEFLTSIGYGGFSGSIKKGAENEYEIIEIDFFQIKPYIENFIVDLMNKSGKIFYMLFDGLDKVRTIAGNPELYNKIITDFLLAIFAFNTKMINKLGNSSRMIIFIRNDILDLLEGDYDDMGKLRGDYRVEINWQEDYLEENSLLNQMIEKRIAKGIEIRNNHKIKKLYTKPLFKNALITSKIMNKYIIRPPTYLQDDFGKFDIQKFLYNKTLLRPRDYVSFFGLFSKSTSIEGFEKDYSNYFKSQTLDEIKKIVKDYSVTEKALEQTCRGTGKFSGEEFIKNYIADRTENTKLIREANDTLRLLYENGVIGYIDKNSFGNTRTRFYYREVDTRAFNPTNCILHSGLYKAYGVI